MKRSKRFKIGILMTAIAFFVFIVSFVFLIFGTELAAMYNVIGIRIATLFVAFASFCSTSLFSYLVYNHNRSLRAANEDANKRASLFRDMQFSSDNYSIVNFSDGMTIDKESTRYIDKYVMKKSLRFHMIENDINEQDIFNNPKDFMYLTLKVPYKIVDCKPVANIIFEKLKFERNNKTYRFISPPSEDSSYAFLLYNDITQCNNAIINLVVKKDSDFFSFDKVNDFSKIKMNLRVNSILGVEVRGIVELYFTNPERKERDGSNTYRINSSLFILTDMPKISDFSYYKNEFLK